MKLLCRLFGHRWAESMINQYFVPVEETCPRCGVKRHHLFRHLRDIDSEPDWQPGGHPNKLVAA